MSPFHVRQPETNPLDLSLSDAEILEQTEKAYANAPGFQPVASWREVFAARRGALEPSG